MDKNQTRSNQNKKQKQKVVSNPLEQLKDIATDTANQMKQEARDLSVDFMSQMFGTPAASSSESYTGEISLGESVAINEIYSGTYEQNKKIKQQTQFERRLLDEERIHIEKKRNELRVQLQAVQTEIVRLAEKTEGLGKEAQIAAMQAPIEPGIYHVVFFEKLFEFIKSFRKKIEEAAVWLQSVNSRASKKNAWGSAYKKHGAKYLLSSEHYVARSAG